jgi:hypothetical protein
MGRMSPRYQPAHFSPRWITEHDTSQRFASAPSQFPSRLALIDA